MGTTTATKPTDSIEGTGYPLAFKMQQGAARSSVLGASEGRDVFVVESRQMVGFQKEGVIHEGDTGSVWRMATDEGKHLGGTDLAPFPLGFFNAGLHADLINRIRTIAAVRDIQLDDVQIDLVNGYYIIGSFIRGDGVGYGEPAQIVVKISSSAAADALSGLIRDAVKASPAMDLMRTAFDNTFAIYVNGRRRVVTSLKNSDAPDAPDPYKTHSAPPAPLEGSDELKDIIWKTGVSEEGTAEAAPTGTDAKLKRIVRKVRGDSVMIDPAGITETDTVLGLPGMSHFALKSDERADIDQAPSGLGLLAAGIAFCYMTQIGRYIQHQKFNIRGVRLVQHTPFSMSGNPADGSWTGKAEPADTHLFLSGEEDDETHERLMTIAANTCYLHATMLAELESNVSVELNGKAIF